MSYWAKVLTVYGGVLIGAASLTLACDPSYPSTGFRCSPSDGASACPDSVNYLCCSDDPAAIDVNDLAAFVTPKYSGGGGVGLPLFSAAANSLSKSGFCIESGSVPINAAIVEGAVGCPIPCNPTWDGGQIAQVCGGGSVCCQTVELETKDCGFDPSLGGSGCWRPVNGGDITGLGGLDVSTWGSSDHATHQDPLGKGCQAFVAGTGFPPDVDPQAVLNACYRRLSVADQRGFCLGGSACPLDIPGYRSACQQLNDAEGRADCG